MTDKLMHIPNDDAQKKSLFWLQLVDEAFAHYKLIWESMNQNWIKVSKVEKPTNKQTLL